MSKEKSENKISIEAMRHSCSHILAQAVMEMFPEAKLGIGPNIEHGFYYDFELPRTLIPEDLPILEKKMKHIIKQKQKFVKREEPIDDARKFLKKAKQDYKVELVDDLKNDGEVNASFYENFLGEEAKFVDLCKGPHLEHTGQVGAFKLTHIAGAYWRGDSERPMLQRIYGLCFADKKDLDEHLMLLEEAKKRDHRKLGEELDLFNTYEETGAGLVYWHPKGGRVRSIIEAFWKEEHFKNGYDIVYTPHIGKSWLWETSGHLAFYKDGMYSPMDIDDEDYYIKPMNCPFHIMMYKHRIRSYRDLPMRWAELGTVYRYEPSGTLHGLLRVRGFTQDDSHIICTPDQVEDEIRKVLKFSLYMLGKFGFNDIKAYLATRPAKSTGSDEDWERATNSLRKAIEAEGLEYEVEEGEGVFYGPKIDLKIKDAIGREWQLSTNQFDFNLPEKFDMTFVGEDGKEHRPYMVHRTLLGSMERFFGVLTEHYAGAFPLWLAPVQVAIIPVSEKFAHYAKEVMEKLVDASIRVEMMDSADTLGKRVRNAEKQKIPFMLVLGEKEMNGKTLAVRSYETKKQEEMKLDKFLKEF